MKDRVLHQCCVGMCMVLPIEATVITPREKNVHKNWPVLTTEMMVQLFVLLLRNQCIAAFCGPSLAWDETGRC